MVIGFPKVIVLGGLYAIEFGKRVMKAYSVFSLQALAGGPLVQARNFAVMTGVNAGISCVMKRLRGKEDVQSRYELAGKILPTLTSLFICCCNGKERSIISGEFFGSSYFFFLQFQAITCLINH